MPSYRIVALFFLAALLAVLSLSVWLRTSAGRDWLVEFASARLAATGYRLQAGESGGNPWRGLALFDLRLEGPGADVRVERLDLAYGLGHLARGRLPLEVRVSGLRGELDPQALRELELAAPGGGDGPRLELRSLEVVDAQLELGGASYALPDLWVRDLHASERPDGLDLTGRLGSGGAEATLQAELDLEPLELRLELDEADVRLARGFWEGAEAGTLSGRLTLLNGPPQGDLELQSGRAALAGLALREVEGPLRYRHPLLHAELTGYALDGPVRASAEVDLEAQVWRASARGRPALAPLSDWLAAGRLDGEVSALAALGGEAEVALEAEGWQAFVLSGEGQGRGSALGRELSLEASFGFASDVGAYAQAAGRLGEGRFEVALEPTETGFVGRLSAAGLTLGEAESVLRTDLEASFAEEGGALRAEATLALTGEVQERPLELSAEARLENSIWRAEATGAFNGAPLGAQARLDGEYLRAQAQLTALGWPVALERTTLELEGPLEDMRWTLALAGDTPLNPLVAGTRIDADLRGRLGGSLNQSELTVDEGRLGPLELRGSYRFSERAGELRYRAEELALTGNLSGEVARLAGTLLFEDHRLETQGELDASGLGAGAVALPELAARFTARSEDGGWALTLSDPRGLDVRYEAGGEGELGAVLGARFDAFPIVLGGDDWTLSGQTEGWGEALELELHALSDHTELRLAGSGELAEVTLVAAPGQFLGPLGLARPLELKGVLRLEGRALELVGRAGALPLELSAVWDEAGLAATAALTSGNDRLETRLALPELAEDELELEGALVAGDLELLGSLPLAPLGDLVGLELVGRLESDLERRGNEWRGATRITMRAADMDWALAVLGDGDAARLHGSGSVAGQPLELRGHLFPELEAALELGEFGAVALRRDPGGALAVTGGGRLSVAALELEESWHLEGSLAAQQAALELGASRAVLWWDNGWRAQATLEQSATLAGITAHLSAELEASAADPAGALSGRLDLEHAAARGALSLAGTLQDARLAGSLPGTLLGAPAESRLELQGEASLIGGLRYALEARGTGLGDAALELALEGADSAWQALLRSDGLTASASGSAETETVWQLELERFAPATFVAALPETLALSGRLESGQAGYGGELIASLSDRAEPVFALQGAGDALILYADSDAAGTRVVASGPLLPMAEVAFEVSRPGLVTLTGALIGTPTSPTLRGELALAAQEAGGLSVPEQRLPVEAGLADQGLWARVGEARLSTEGWSGALALELALQGEDHRLAGPLRGPLAAPRWEAELTGPSATGTLHTSAASAEGRVSIDARPWLGAHGEGRLEGAFEATSDGRWSLTLTGAGKAAALPDSTVELAGTVEGEGSAYRGEGSLLVTGQSLAWRVMGEGGELRAVIEGEDLALESLPLPEGVSGRATGSLELERGANGAFGYRAALEAAGELRGEAYALSLQGDEGGLALSGTVGEIALDGDFRENTLALRALGRWNDEELEVEVGYASGAGRWQARYGQHQLTGGLRADAPGLAFTGEGALAALPGLGTPAALSLSGRWQEGRLALETAALEGEAFALALSGRAWPETALTGELHTAALGEPLALELNSADAAYRLRLEGGETRAALTFDPIAAAWRLEALELALPAGLELTATGAGNVVSGTLMGALRGQGKRLPFTASYGMDGLSLAAQGPLFAGQLELEAHHQDDAGWAGTFKAAGLELAGTVLFAQGVIHGALGAPELTGTVSGVAPWAEAAATFRASPSALELEGKLDAALLDEPLEVVGQLWPATDFSLTSGTQTLRVADGNAEGNLRLKLGDELARLELNADAPGGRELVLALGGEAGPRLRGGWPDDLGQGLRLVGVDNTVGSVVVTTEPLRLELDALRWTGALGAGELSGALALPSGSPQGSLAGSWTWPDAPGWLPGLDALGTTAFEVELAAGHLEFRADELQGALFWEEALAAHLQGSQRIGAGEIALDLRYHEREGPSGSITVQDLTLLAPESAQGLGTLSLFAELELSPAGLSGAARLEAERGIFRLSGEAGWQRVLSEELTARFVPEAGNNLQGLARLEAFNLAYLPAVATALPELDAPVSGVAQFIGDTVLGQVLIPELEIASRTLASEFDFSGNWQGVDITGRVDRSRMTLRYGDNQLSGLVNLEGFPAESLIEARFGPTGVSASATALLRFDVPLGDLAKSDIRLASERIRLEQGSAVSEGQLALRYDEGGLVLETAEFHGAGHWRASGSLGPEGLDFALQAEDADFGPLLALVPALAGLQPGLKGSLDLRLGGAAAAPTLSATSPELELTLGGAHYRLVDSALEVADGQARGQGRLEGVVPVGGALELSLGGRLRLFPFEASDVSLAFGGSAELPAIGLVTGIDGTVASDAEGWRLVSSGELGEHFTLSGTLAPLDLELHGRHLAVAAPQYYLLGSTLDAALRLRYAEGYRLSGRLFGHEARVGFEGRAARGGAEGELVVREGGRNPLLERIVFDSLEVAVPQQLSFRESLGSLEMSAELTLTGSAAEPLLAGHARLLRGSLRFSGRDFTLQEAEALFAPARGPYPLIRARAETSFDKARVLPAELRASVSFAAPRESQTFRVVLEFAGEFEETAPGVQRLRLTPSLSSDAVLEDRRGGGSNGGGATLRPLEDEEIVTLLALGRLELGADVRQALLGESVAQTALDTAIDLYLLSELQRALAEALGVELFEIRAGALSGLLEAGESDFSVAVRIGAYLSDEVFASVSLGRFQYAPETYALGGGFNLRYDLSPLELSLSGGLGLPGSGPRARGPQLGPVPEFNLGLSYGVTPLVNLGAGLDLRGGRDTSFGLRFGLDFRW